MTKIFTCCELIKRIKDFQAEGNQKDEDKYLANEFLHKAVLKITNKRIKEWVNSEPVWTADYDYLFCDECKKWFKKQEELQMKLIDAEIEKEKAEGKYYGPKNPKTYEGTAIEETVRKLKEKADRYQKELKNKSHRPFWSNPQEGK